MVAPAWTIRYTEQAVEDFHYWSRQDKKTLKRILALVENISMTPCSGLGKPERLRHALTGCWSRRIDATNRLVYTVDEDNHEVRILQARWHYSRR